MREIAERSIPIADNPFFRSSVQLGRRLILTLLHLAILVFLITLTQRLALSGGVQSLGESIPEAASISSRFIQDLLRGGSPVVEEMLKLLPRSLGLLMIALTVGTVFGLSLGGIAAIRKGSRLSTFLMTASVILISTPSYVVAMFLIWSVVWFFQSTGVRILPTFGFGWDVHLILPTIVLAIRPLASMLRLSYSSLVDILQTDFIRTARSKGLNSRAVFLRHVIRNAGVPLLTTIGVSFRFSLAVLPIVEFIFSWSGIGLALLESIQTGNLNRVLIMVLPLAALFILANIIMDFLFQIIDPRLRKFAE